MTTADKGGWLVSSREGCHGNGVICYKRYNGVEAERFNMLQSRLDMGRSDNSSIVMADWYGALSWQWCNLL